MRGSFEEKESSFYGCGSQIFDRLRIGPGRVCVKSSPEIIPGNVFTKTDIFLQPGIIKDMAKECALLRMEFWKEEKSNNKEKINIAEDEAADQYFKCCVFYLLYHSDIVTQGL